MEKNNPIPDCSNCESRHRSVFCDLDAKGLSVLNADKGFLTFRKGQSVFHQGGRPAGLFCINQGKVKIHQLGVEGKEQIVRLAKAGDIIGYRALLGGESYNATATALDDCKVCFIPRQVFFRELEAYPSMALSVMSLLSHNLEKAEQKITDLVQKPVRERVAEALLFLKETYGLDGENALNVNLSREDIANLAGTARETTIRLLSDLRQEGIISLDGKKIRLLDLKELLREANISI